MANNYTISKAVTSEAQNDSPGAGTMASSAQLIITPDSGYVIQARDFSIGTTLPPEITSVTFADTTTALDVTNKVRVTVNVASWYAMPAADTTINIDIDGLTHSPNARLHFTTTNSNVDNITATVTSSGTLAKTIDDAVETNTIYQDIDISTSAQVCQMVVTAADNYFLPTMPSFRIVSTDLARWSPTTTKVHDSNGRLTSVTFTFDYSIGTEDIPASDGENIVFTIPAAEANPVTYTHINSVQYIGFNDNSLLPQGDITLELWVAGTENSTYDIKVEDNSDKTYDFTSDDGTFSRELTTSGTQTIYSAAEQIVRDRDIGFNRHFITIPFNHVKDRSIQFTYTTTITPTGSTFSNIDGTSSDPFTITLHQWNSVAHSIMVSAADTGTTATSTTIKSVTYRSPLTYLSTFNPTDFPNLSTINNGYFSYSSPLSYTVTGTVASHTHEGTSVVLTATSAVLKLQTGDTVTGTGVDTDTTITVDGTTTIVLSKNSTATISGTLTFTRTVGISRQPLVTDFYTLVNAVEFPAVGDGRSYIEKAVKETLTDSTMFELENIDDSTSILVGQTVTGDNISGYPTITAVTGNVIVLSSSQSLQVGDIVKLSNEMFESHISEVSVTGAGTASCTLNAKGYISRAGKTTLVQYLDLDDFTSVYTSPTAAAFTGANAFTCTHGETIQISPLASCTGHTGTLNIVAPLTSEGRSGQASVSDDKQSIMYQAPSSGTTDTVTYTINDGVNTSAEAGITINLTSY